MTDDKKDEGIVVEIRQRWTGGVIPTVPCGEPTDTGLGFKMYECGHVDPKLLAEAVRDLHALLDILDVVVHNPMTYPVALAFAQRGIRIGCDAWPNFAYARWSKDIGLSGGWLDHYNREWIPDSVAVSRHDYRIWKAPPVHVHLVPTEK